MNLNEIVWSCHDHGVMEFESLVARVEREYAPVMDSALSHKEVVTVVVFDCPVCGRACSEVEQ